MQPHELATRCPVLFHLAEAGSWPSIARHGLLSTTALLDRFEKTGVERRRIESAHRTHGIPIQHPEHGEAWIRDQKPLNEKKLLTCLQGMTPLEWYETLNRKVFFWLTVERLRGLLGARPYRGRTHTVIRVDTAALLERHGSRITLSPINSGSTIYKPAKRGVGTFLPLAQYPTDWWRRRRVAELAVDYAVPDIMEVARSVEEWRADRQIALVWGRR